VEIDAGVSADEAYGTLPSTTANGWRYNPSWSCEADDDDDVCFSVCLSVSVYISLCFSVCICLSVSVSVLRSPAAVDGRISVGDVIVDVNTVSLESMSDAEAVNTLCDAVRNSR